MSARRGSSSTTIGLSLFVLCGFAALAIDVSMLVVGRGQLQNAYDAAALGGAAYLDGSPEGSLKAKTFAVQVGNTHNLLGNTVALIADDVELGTITNGDSTTFAVEVDPAKQNAVRVRPVNSMTGAFFARIFGATNLSVGAETIALRPPSEGAAGVKCYLPIALPSCLVNDLGGAGVYDLAFANDNIDNTGWALAGNVSVGGSALVQQVSGDCVGAPATIGGQLSFNNGAVASVLKDITDAVEASPDMWSDMTWSKEGQLSLPPKNGGNVSPTAYGRVLAGPVMVFDAPDCDDVKFTGTETITSFRYGAIFDTKETGNPKGVRIALDLVNEYSVGNEGGGDPNSTIRYQAPPYLAH